ncbi:aminoglycoside phosphotransferase family protein [Yinghuangia soli]|uniref:Aminoglycoside phosphotransferase family protein n=1 Tax=Yinghuangia soli TaxID=2908204 RepID=A0AA41PWE3_9ACTN|nr:aminoglycoside phosphotransferase family protein [Yinghuangia soli]MCF2526953.1 aminoglycoside phosphotransferase family protein [Yinghuangia soli]
MSSSNANLRTSTGAPAAEGAPGRGDVRVPPGFVAAYGTGDPARQAWLDELPRLADDLIGRWELRPDGGEPAYGMASLVVPVTRADGTPAVLQLRQVTEDNAGAALGLRTWGGHGAVRLLDHDPDSGCMLLERLDAARPLSSVADDDAAMRALADVMARLVAVPAPAGLRRLADIAAAMVDAVPDAVDQLKDPDERRLVHICAAAVRELIPDLDAADDRLLHWDLHYDNVLAGDREPWLAIDPEPLAGDPGFELLPAMDNRWDEVTAGGDVPGVVLRRFDTLTEALTLDRRRATGWTLGRVLQNALWDIEDGRHALEPAQVAIAEVLIEHR